MPDSFSLANHGITVTEVLRNPSPARLYELGLQREKGTAITSTGALVALSGPLVRPVAGASIRVRQDCFH